MRETVFASARAHTHEAFFIALAITDVARLALRVVRAFRDRDRRDWEKAAKLFFSALKNANASTRAALCKDPEGAIENLMEGETIEDVIQYRVLQAESERLRARVEEARSRREARSTLMRLQERRGRIDVAQ